MKIGRYLRLALLSSALAWPALARAQTDQAPPVDGVDEIIVTAQKRSQSLSSVGMTIKAATGDQLRERGVENVADLIKIEPSFVPTRNGRGETIYSIRGIGFNSDTLGAPPAVSVYVDQVAFPFGALSKGATLDIERVEILKGPQGTLFGQNATGGAINYVAAKPTDSFKAGFDTSLARFGAVSVEGFVSGPLSDTLRARLAVSLEEGGAWQRSTTRDASLGDRDNKYARLLLDWTPTDRLTIAINLNGWTNNSDNQAAAISAIALQRPAFASSVPLTVNSPIAPHDPRAADWPTQERPRNDQDYYQGSLRIDYALSDAAALTYLGTYQHFKADDVLTFTGTASPFYALSHAKIRSTAHELRASGKLAGQKLEWLIGGTYSKDKDSENEYRRVIGVTTAYSLVALPGVTGPLIAVNPVMTQDIETKAVFGNLEYHLLDNLSVHGSARYTKTVNDHVGCQRAPDAAAANTFTAFERLRRGGVGVVPINVGDCSTLDPVNFLPTLVVDSLSEDNVSWRFGIDWTPIERTLLYATVSKGYKAGSFPNIGAVSTRSLAPAVQEAVTAYEAGFKSRLLDGKLQFDGAVFHYDYRNKQQQLRVPDPAFGLLNILLNVPKSKETGAEVSITVRPAAGLSLNASGVYLDSKVVGNFFNYSQFALSAATTTNFRGDPLPNTPKWSFNAGARYEWALGSNHSAYLSGDVRYSSKTQSFFGDYSSAAAGFPSMVNKSYVLLDLRAGVETDDQRWRWEVFGENVTNSYYTIQSVRVDTVARFTGMPASYGVRLAYRY